MAQNDKQNTVVSKSSVPLLLVAKVSTQLPELPASISLWEGKRLLSSNRRKTSHGWKTLPSPPLFLEMLCHSLFSWSWWKVLFTRRVQNLEVFSGVCQTVRPRWILRHEVLLWFCTYLCTFFPSICHSFAFAVNAVELQAPMMELFFLEYHFCRWKPPKTNSSHLCAEVKTLKTYFKL